MKKNVQPKYNELTVTCNCGNTFVTRSTLDKKQITIEICSMCHPFYTGTQKLVDSGGRVDRFRQKYGKKEKAAEPEVKKETVKTIEKKEKATETEVKKEAVKTTEKKEKEEKKKEVSKKKMAAKKKEASPKEK